MISIGTVISGRKIYAVYENNYCLARSIDETDPEPFTVWHIDNDGNGVHSGKYFKFGDDAERHFAWLCFDWFSDEQKEPASEDEAPEQTAKALKVGIEKFGVPQSIHVDKGIDINRMSENAANYKKSTDVMALNERMILKSVIKTILNKVLISETPKISDAKKIKLIDELFSREELKELHFSGVFYEVIEDFHFRRYDFVKLKFML